MEDITAAEMIMQNDFFRDCQLEDGQHEYYIVTFEQKKGTDFTGEAPISDWVERAKQNGIERQFVGRTIGIYEKGTETGRRWQLFRKDKPEKILEYDNEYDWFQKLQKCAKMYCSKGKEEAV